MNPTNLHFSAPDFFAIESALKIASFIHFLWSDPGRKDAQPLKAEIVRLLTHAPGKRPVLHLVITEAAHGKRTFKVAVRTLPAQ